MTYIDQCHKVNKEVGRGHDTLLPSERYSGHMQADVWDVTGNGMQTIPDPDTASLIRKVITPQQIIFLCPIGSRGNMRVF